MRKSTLDGQGKPTFVDTTSWYLRTGAFWFATSFKWFILFILLPLQVREFAATGAANAAWGNVVAIGAVEAMFGPAIFGWISDRSRSRFGRRKPFIAIGAGLTALSLFVLGNATSLTWLIVAYLCLQLSDDIATGPYASIVPDYVPQQHRGKASGLVGMLQLVAQIVAAAVGFVLSGNLIAVYMAIAIVNIICAIIVLFSIHESPVTQVPSSARFQLSDWLAPWKSKDFCRVWAGRFLVALGFYILTNYAINYMKDTVKVFTIGPFLRISDPAQAAIIVVLGMSLAGAIISPLAGKWVDVYGRRKVITWSGWVMFTTLIPFALLPIYSAVVFIGLVFGAAYGVYIAASVAIAADVLPNAGDSAKDMGIWQASVSTPQIVSGACGVLIDTLNKQSQGIGYTVVFLIAAVCFLVGCILVKYVKNTT